MSQSNGCCSFEFPSFDGIFIKQNLTNNNKVLGLIINYSNLGFVTWRGLRTMPNAKGRYSWL